MYSFLYVVLFIVVTTAPLLWYHQQQHGVNNWVQAALALFNNINVLICIWEMGLGINIKLIQSQYQAMKRKLPPGGLPQPIFMFRRVPFAEAIGLKHWALVWSTYSLMDPSYSDTTTFGWNIDVGNGFSTFIPSIVFNLCMTWDLGISARILGMVAVAMYWQEMYGTIIYFLSYIVNQRWKGRPGLPVVIVSNNVWIAGPALGLYAAYQMVMQDSFAVFRS